MSPFYSLKTVKSRGLQQFVSAKLKCPRRRAHQIRNRAYRFCLHRAGNLLTGTAALKGRFNLVEQCAVSLLVIAYPPAGHKSLARDLGR